MRTISTIIKQRGGSYMKPYSIHSTTQANNPMAVISEIIGLGAASRHTRNMTPEELEEMSRQWTMRDAQNTYYNLIYNKHQCPSCDGTLIRGKKNKKRSYMRGYTCNDCHITHYV